MRKHCLTRASGVPYACRRRRHLRSWLSSGCWRELGEEIRLRVLHLIVLIFRVSIDRLVVAVRRRRVKLRCSSRGASKARMLRSHHVWRQRIRSRRSSQLSGAMSRSGSRMWEVLDVFGGWDTGRRRRMRRGSHGSRSRQRPSLDLRLGHDRTIFRGSNTLCPLPSLRLRSRIVVCELQSDLPSVFPFASQALPNVILAASRNDDVAQIKESLANQFCLLVLCEDRKLQVVVIRGVVNGEAQFGIPARSIER